MRVRSKTEAPDHHGWSTACEARNAVLVNATASSLLGTTLHISRHIDELFSYLAV